MPAVAPTSSVAAMTFEVKREGNALQLLPAGDFRSIDGRPAECATWKTSAAIAKRVIAHAAARQTDMVIDYEHQTLLSEQNGLPAPAAGWVQRAKLQWREDGLWATDVSWTDKASAHLSGAVPEYKYFSPVFSYDAKTGEVLQILHGALTNNPGLDNLAQVSAALSARFTPQHKQEQHVELSEIIALLGLPADTSEEAARAALKSIKTKADATAGLETQVASLKSAVPDPTKFVPIEGVTALQAQLTELSAKITGSEVDNIVTEALKANKLTPALEGWARELGKKDVAALRGFIDKAAPVAPGAHQSGGNAPGGDGASPSASAVAICSQLGLTTEQFAKGKRA